VPADTFGAFAANFAKETFPPLSFGVLCRCFDRTDALYHRVFYIWEELHRWMYPHDDDPRQPDGRGILPQLLPFDEADRARFEAQLPIQVFSCWNGATAIDASAFLPPHDLRFRVAKADLDERGRPKEVTEIISECFLSSVDLWKMGKGKIVLAPRARCVLRASPALRVLATHTRSCRSVAYNLHNYDDHRKDQLRPAYDPQDEIVTFVPNPPARVAFQDNAKWNEPEVCYFSLVLHTGCSYIRSDGDHGTSSEDLARSRHHISLGCFVG
jgi:alpha-1,3-mannosyltransferase